MTNFPEPPAHTPDPQPLITSHWLLSALGTDEFPVIGCSLSSIRLPRKTLFFG